MKQNLIILILSLLIITGCSSRTSSTEDAAGSAKEPDPNPTQSESVGSANSSLDPSSSGEPTTPSTLKLVVPEGYTAARIGMRLEELGVCTVDDFLEATQTGDFSEFPLVAQQQPDPNRCFVLEGYLFPDTYEIYPDETPNSIIRKMLANTESKFSIELREKIQQSGYTVDEILTIASIIQKEAYERNDNPVPQEMPLVSSVLHNRLNTGEMIQCNVTATYVNGVLKEFVENGFERYNDYYNTYHCPALPAGAICNPSLDSINAAVSPAETDYLFFLTDKDKNFYYSATYEEHLVLVEKHLSDED